MLELQQFFWGLMKMMSIEETKKLNPELQFLSCIGCKCGEKEEINSSKQDDDNYDRFAALVISDMNSGPLHDAALNDGDTLIVGEADPLHMTAEQRQHQKTKSVTTL